MVGDQDDMRPKQDTVQSVHSGKYTLDSCLVCLKTKDKLTRLLMHLQGTKNADNQAGLGNTIEQIIEGLDAFIEDLLEKDKEVELARSKVNADVEKLIQNQESFERRVAEMDQVYAMLMTEQKRLKDRKSNLDTLQQALPTLTRELTEIRKENDRLRYEVSIAVEDEVRKAINSHRLGIEMSLLNDTQTSSHQPLRQNPNTQHNKSYDMPR